MGNRFVLNVKNKRDEVVFSCYWHWGADIGSEIFYTSHVAKALADCCGSEPKEILIRKVIDEFPNMGLCTSPTWWDTRKWEDRKDDGFISDEYKKEFPEVQALLDKGIPEGQDRSDGLIIVGETAQGIAESWAEAYFDIEFGTAINMTDFFWVEEEFKEQYDYLDEEDIASIKELPKECYEDYDWEDADKMNSLYESLADDFYIGKDGTYYSIR